MSKFTLGQRQFPTLGLRSQQPKNYVGPTLSCYLGRQKRHIQKLKDLNESLERKNASLRKKYCRLNQKCKSVAYSLRSKVRKDIRDSGISPRKHPKIAHQLLFNNCLTEEIKASVSKNLLSTT